MAMGLPETTKILHVGFDIKTNEALITIDDPSFSSIADGLNIPLVVAVFEKQPAIFNFKEYK